LKCSLGRIYLLYDSKGNVFDKQSDKKFAEFLPLIFYFRLLKGYFGSDLIIEIFILLLLTKLRFYFGNMILIGGMIFKSKI